MIQIIVLPFHVAANKHNILNKKPIANHADIGGPVMIIHHIRHRHVHLIRDPDQVVRLEESHSMTILDAPPNQIITVTKKQLNIEINNLANKSEAAQQIAIKTDIPLHEDPIKDNILRIINPVLLDK